MDELPCSHPTEHVRVVGTAKTGGRGNEGHDCVSSTAPSPSPSAADHAHQNDDSHRDIIANRMQVELRGLSVDKVAAKSSSGATLKAAVAFVCEEVRIVL